MALQNIFKNNKQQIKCSKQRKTATGIPKKWAIHVLLMKLASSTNIDCDFTLKQSKKINNLASVKECLDAAYYH